ncbi:hypothetical protein D3C75_1147610 [compost metagenome]
MNVSSGWVCNIEYLGVNCAFSDKYVIKVADVVYISPTSEGNMVGIIGYSPTVYLY